MHAGMKSNYLFIMNKTFIFQKNTRFIAGILGLAMLQFASSCKTTDDPTASKKDSIVTEQVYKDVEYASMTSSLSVGRTSIQTTTIGSKSYFVGGGDFGLNIPPRFSKVIDVFDGNSLSWSTEAFSSSYTQGYFLVAGSKIFFTGPNTLSGIETPKSEIMTYDFISKTAASYRIGSARFPDHIAASETKVILGGAYSSYPRGDSSAIDIIETSGNETLSTKLPGGGSILDMTTYKKKLYVLSTRKPSGIQVYDLTTKTWSVIDMGTVSADRIIVTDNKVITRYINAAAINIYDLDSKEWKSVSLSIRRSTVDIIAAGNKVFFAGGVSTEGNSATSTDLVEIYDTRTGVVSSKKLSEKRLGSGAAVNGKFVLFAGGYDLSKNPYTPFKTVDFFTLKK